MSMEGNPAPSLPPPPPPHTTATQSVSACGSPVPPVPHVTMSSRHTEIASLDIPPRSSCRESQLQSSSIHLPPLSVSTSSKASLNDTAVNGPAISASQTANSCRHASLSSISLPNTAGHHHQTTQDSSIVHRESPSSITIKIYRPPVLVGGTNTLMTGKGSKCDPRHVANGGACLSLVRPALQAQECSSDDLRVTVPPIRSEVMLNVSSFNTPLSMSAPITSPVCPRPVPGPEQPGPVYPGPDPSPGPVQPGPVYPGPDPSPGPVQPGTVYPGPGHSPVRPGSVYPGSDPSPVSGPGPGSGPSPVQLDSAYPGPGPVHPGPGNQGPGPASDSRSDNPSTDGPSSTNVTSNSTGAHCNIPSVKPKRQNVNSGQPVPALTSSNSLVNSRDPPPLPPPPHPQPKQRDSYDKSEQNGLPESPVTTLTSEQSNSLSSDSSTTSNISVICTTAAPNTTVLYPLVDGDQTTQPSSERNGNVQSENCVASVESKTNTEAQNTGLPDFKEVSNFDIDGTVKLTPRQAFFIRGPISPQPIPPPVDEGRGDERRMSRPPSSSSLVSSSSCSSLPQHTSLGKLPPRPPIKKLSLTPLQLQGSPSSATTSPTGGPAAPSNLGSSRRSLGTISAGGASRVLPPLQMYMFTRRPSNSSQDSVPGCLTPTKSTPPPGSLSSGRFPNMSSPLSNPHGVPPFYQHHQHHHTSSPVTSPYSDSPSSSRPPSWYNMRYGFSRGRDSSPSATSRDSLDSFIRPPPSGIFSSANSTGNLLASRSSMDNLSDTSGDSVFDDIMSESEKKSLDDTAESVGSLGSLNIVDTDTNGHSCETVAAPDGASHQARMPSGGRMSKQASFDMSSVQEVSVGGDVMVTSPSVTSVMTPTVTSSGGSQAVITQAQQSAQVQLQSVGPEPPPSYEEAIGLVPEGASSCHLLTYKDFVPNQDHQRRSWEPFNKVVQRANGWLVMNPDVRIASCESVLGFAAQSDGFNPDRSVGTRSQIVTESTYYLRFLRVWYSRLDQISNDVEAQQLRYANFISVSDNANINTLMELINSKLNCAIKGDILNVETLYILRKALQCPDTSCWREQPCDTKSYSFFLRIFWLEPQEERQQHISLGFMDIVPQHASGRNYPHNYEPFAVLVQVGQWWARHKADLGCHIINVQSLYVKQKALCQAFWQRVHFTESAGGGNSLKYTMYNQILRIYYQTPVSTLATPVSSSIKISYRTFTPVQLTSPTDPCLKFESYGETVNRVLHWLKLSGAQLLSIETIKIRMYGGMQGPHGAECTLLRSEGRKYCAREHWLHCIRVYFVGEYQEPDLTRIPPIPHVVPYFTTSPRPIAFLAPTIAFS